MIYFTGDIHANMDERKTFFDTLTENDILIVLGDFGYSWNKNIMQIWNDFRFPFTTLSVLGNHENYSAIYEIYPRDNKFGGEVYKFNDNTFYLKNGEMYYIEGHKFLVFGGALSIDKAMRVPYISWWEQEQPTMADYNRALENLKKNDYKFDELLTHTGSNEEVFNMFMFSQRVKDTTQDMIENIIEEIKKNGGKFNNHFFGHMHEFVEENYGDYHSYCLYRQIYDYNNRKFLE